MIGIGVFHGKFENNVGTLWRAAHLYDVDFLFTINHRYIPQATDTSKAWREIPLINYPDLATFSIARPLDAPLIGVEMTHKATPLHRYIHPRSAIYILGAEDHGLTPEVLDLCKDVIQIEAAWSTRSMNVAMAGSIVLYDRWIKKEK